jgi:hypothetical protein
MYDVTASKGLAAFILMRESREHKEDRRREVLQVELLMENPDGG